MFPCYKNKYFPSHIRICIRVANKRRSDLVLVNSLDCVECIPTSLS